jgi:putative SOS response-associated peptidase YedK
MCGRFTLTVELNELLRTFPWLTVPDVPAPPRYNVAPTQPVAVVANNHNTTLDFFTWGLIPSWAKDPTIGSRMINARAETLAEKPAFRAAYRRRRCLILADGFYEWRKEPGSKAKTPMYVQLKSGEPFGFAGLWEAWNSPHGDLILSCTIITTTPNKLMKPIHDRMPVILPPEAYTEWLDPAEKQPDQVNGLLVPYPADRMQAHPVSTVVNSPANDVPECIEPVA